MLDNKNIAGYLLHILIFIKPILFILFILGKGMHIDIKTFTYSNSQVNMSWIYGYLKVSHSIIPDWLLALRGIGWRVKP